MMASGLIHYGSAPQRRGRITAAVFIAALLAGGNVASGEPPVSYDRDIRPLLSDRCFHCHGPDPATREAGLRLDTYGGMTEYVVVPGRPDQSELVARITSDDHSVRMPPSGSNLSLSDAEKELLKRWIAEGADYSEHWAFTPLPDRVEVPAVENDAWPRQTLDRFILARLEQEGIEPSPAAAPLRLLRRLTLDLTGLPPTAEEIRQFERASAERPDRALEQAVDRLLASTAFGEHMAVAWLDAARYADSFGYQSDQLNTQWPYRDWVVRALNANMPYDEFISVQLAGDLVAQRNATEKPPSAGRSEPRSQATGHPGRPIARQIPIAGESRPRVRDAILATAFNRMNRLTNEGGSLSEEWLVENAADRLHTFGTAMLGLTLECARCHDHKYDPISQRDYYSMLAFFNSIDENGMYDHAAKVPSPTLALPTAAQEEALAAAERSVAEAEAALEAAIADGQQRFAEWLVDAAFDASLGTNPDLIGHFTFDEKDDRVRNHAPARDGEGMAPGVERVEGFHGRAVQFDGDRGVEFPGLAEFDRWDEFTFDFWMRDQARDARPVVLLHRTFGTDVGYNGLDVMLADGVLKLRLYRIWPGNGIGVRALEPINAGQWHRITVTYDGSSRAAGLRLYVDGQEVATETLRDRIFKSAAVKTYGNGHLTLGARFRDRGFKDGQIDQFRVYDRALTPLEVQHHRPESVREAVSQLGESRPCDVEAPLREYYFSAFDRPSRELSRQLRDARRQLVELEEQVHEVAVMEELPEPRPTHMLARGEYDAPRSDDNRVERDTFADILLPFPKDAPRDRLGLAQWMTDPRHPLTARVLVNRIWAQFFGSGLVRTPENFGRQGETPKHRELLDWLARDFVDHGWDVKRLCRQIALSATYRQDSRHRPELTRRDPENELLARGRSQRLSAEQVRDVALAASGLLERHVGGEPVSPYQPGDDLWREANDMSPPYRQSTGKGLYRRSLYSVWKRTSPLPNMIAFDATTREVCVVARSSTNTPLQALVLLNDVQFVEAARVLAETVSHEHSLPGEQIRAAFLRLAGREPDHVEHQLLIEIYDEQQTFFAAEHGEHNADDYLRVGERPLAPSDQPADELAALTAVCQAIMNLDAMIFNR